MTPNQALQVRSTRKAGSNAIAQTSLLYMCFLFRNSEMMIIMFTIKFCSFDPHPLLTDSFLIFP